LEEPIKAGMSAADTVADSSTKPEAAAAYTAETATVRTMAVTIPVTEQMLADAPALISAINGRLVYDLDKLLEEQMLYGAGTGQDFPGILNDSDVAAARSVSGDSTVDKIRRAMSDIRTNGFEPNAVVMHPLDFEEVEDGLGRLLREPLPRVEGAALQQLDYLAADGRADAGQRLQARQPLLARYPRDRARPRLKRLGRVVRRRQW
jgi:HK97 family phage major capsid protein